MISLEKEYQAVYSEILKWSPFEEKIDASYTERFLENIGKTNGDKKRRNRIIEEIQDKYLEWEGYTELVGKLVIFVNKFTKEKITKGRKEFFQEWLGGILEAHINDTIIKTLVEPHSSHSRRVREYLRSHNKHMKLTKNRYSFCEIESSLTFLIEIEGLLE